MPAQPRNALLVEVSDGVAVVTISRPEQRNAMNAALQDELAARLDELAADDGVQVVVITGAGEQAFVAGADIGQLQGFTAQDGLHRRMQRLFDRLEDFEKPTIAAINGYAVGGGAELAMACDIRVASSNARIGLPETSLAIMPGAGGTQRLARLVGLGRAIELILTGRLVDAQEALAIGLVTSVVPQAELIDHARGIAATIAAKGPLATRLATLVVRTGFEADQRSGQVMEMLAQALLYTTADKAEGTAAFLEKRSPSFTGGT